LKFEIHLTLGNLKIHAFTNASKFHQDVGISVMAVLNDSTGTLMSCAHKNLNCRIGVIIGKEKKNETLNIVIVYSKKVSILSQNNQSIGFQNIF
jgi:hypothetical protein